VLGVAPSSWQRNVAFGSLEANANVAELLLVSAGGVVVRVVSGAAGAAVIS